MPKIQCVCKRILSYREDQAGKRVKCPACSARIVLPGDAPVEVEPPGADEAMSMLNQRLAAQAAGMAPDAAPLVAPRHEPPLAAQPGRTTPGRVMPNAPLKLDPAEADIPIAGEVPTWNSGPQPDAPPT